MKIRCVACQSMFRSKIDRINVGGSMVRCLKCGYIFTVYPPDYKGSPSTQDTNIDQSILEDLLKMQNHLGVQMSIGESFRQAQTSRIDDMGTIEDYGEEISASDTDAAKYAGLPDLTELEKMIDWGDIKDRDDLAANLEQNYLDAQDADIKIA